MNYRYHIGVDVSKLTLDFTILKEGTFLLHQKVENTQAAIRGWLKDLMHAHKAGGRRTLFCVENTGIYSTPLCEVLSAQKRPLWLENPTQIKLSIGLQRGKNDQLDSLRIAQYAFSHQHSARLWQAPRSVVLELKLLRSHRERLKKAKHLLSLYGSEVKTFHRSALTQTLLRHSASSIASLKEDIVSTESAIKRLIMDDEALRELYTWITSVIGVGPVLATELLITTNEFKSFASSRKFACYCGIAPFTYSSGTSLHTKGRVSKKANLRMKMLLHNAAMSVLRSKGDFKSYYERRTGEGKSKLSVINAIRNKIVHRVFACVRDKRPYQPSLV